MSLLKALPQASLVPPVLAPDVAQASPAQWQLLDDPQEWAGFSQQDKTQPGCWASSVVFEGMHCAACAINLEDALRQVPGVQSVQVSSASHRGRVVWSPSLTRPSEWMQAVERAGYRALPANDAQAHEQRRQEARRMVWRLAVAALCMMQVMMYATPAYVSEPGDISPDMVALLRWASWVLSLPVMLFSCTPFLSAAWRDLMRRQISMDLPVALGMVVTFAVSTLGTFEPDGPFGAEVYFDSLTMFVFFLLTGRWLELRLRDRTAGALEAVLNRLPASVRRRSSDGQWLQVPIRKLAVGDVIEVLPGEAMAADGVVLSGQTLVDEALLTGESRPLLRAVGERVIAGSYNLHGRIEVQVEQVGAATRYAQIVSLMESASVAKPSIALLADRLARPFLLAVLLASLGAAVHGWSQGPAHALMVAVAVLVVTCPCALSLATPAAMLATAGALARSGVLVRRLDALQSLAEVDTVLFDKTGTLTRDAFAVHAIHTREGSSAEEALQLAGALARHSLHPVSRALWAHARQQCQSPQALERLESLNAFDVQELAGQGVSGRLPAEGGQAERSLRLGSASFCAAPVRPTGHLQVSLADAGGWLATFELQEDLRPEAASVVQALQALGMKVQLLSGDLPAAVQPVAEAVGIAHARGACTPQDKLAVLQSLQAEGRRVAMVGDGLNDGPVLAGADVSFALGQAVPLAQSRSDFVLLGGQLTALVQTLQRSRQTLAVVRQNLVWAAVYNAACVPLAMAGWLPAWAAGLGMALSSLLVVLNALRLSGALDLEAGAVQN
jgi:Cu2+-exporting ATPase